MGLSGPLIQGSVCKAFVCSYKGPLALIRGILFSFGQVRGNLATKKQQDALRQPKMENIGHTLSENRLRYKKSPGKPGDGSVEKWRWL